MEATLYGVSGPGISVKAPVRQGTPVTVGRTDKASVVVPADITMSGLHFSVELQGEQLVLRDLGSTNGTFVSGARVQAVVLRGGESFSAGQSVFRTEIQRGLPDPFAVLSAETEPLYAILDAARGPRVLEMLRLSGTPFHSLHEGKQAAELELVAPYLVPLASHGDLLRSIVAEGWGKSWGIFFTCQQPIHLIWQQLRRSLTVTMEADGSEVYFRYYDPRVLRDVLPILDAQQLEELGGPINCFLLEDETEDGLLRFTWPGGVGKTENIAVGSVPK